MNNKELLIDFINYAKSEYGMPIHKIDIEPLVDDYLRQQNLQQCDVSGSLQDRLFKLANDFAVAKQGEVAVKLHSIHNGLHCRNKRSN